MRHVTDFAVATTDAEVRSTTSGGASAHAVLAGMHVLLVGRFPPMNDAQALRATGLAAAIVQAGGTVTSVSVSGHGDAHLIADFDKAHGLKRLRRALREERRRGAFDLVVIDRSAFSFRKPDRLARLAVAPQQLLTAAWLCRLGRQTMLLGERCGGCEPLARAATQWMSLAARHAPDPEVVALLTAAAEAGAKGEIAADMLPTLVSAIPGGRGEALAVGLALELRGERVQIEPTAAFAPQITPPRLAKAFDQDPAWPTAAVPRIVAHLHRLRARDNAQADAATVLDWYAQQRELDPALPPPEPPSKRGGALPEADDQTPISALWWTALAGKGALNAPISAASPDPARIDALLARPSSEPGSDRMRDLADALSALPMPRLAKTAFALAGDDPAALETRLGLTERIAPTCCIVGHRDRATGLGANLIMAESMLQRAGLSPVARVIEAGLAPSSSLRVSTAGSEMDVGQPVPRRLSRPLRLFCVNADLVPQTLLHPRLSGDANGVNIGFLLWELDRLPDAHRLALDMLDEIWCPTAFVARAYRTQARQPVRVMGKAVTAPKPDPLDRRALGLPENAFLFLTSFDFHSSVERKNPVALVHAFQDAFPTRRDVRLVVKTTETPSGHWGDPHGQWNAIVEAAAADPRILLRTGRWPAGRQAALVAACDCFVSPHRAEGFGYGPAEALLLGRPVIATDYSGTTAYLSEKTGYPVPFALRDVATGETIHAVEGARWAEIDRDALAATLAEVVDADEDRAQRAAAGRALLETEFSLDAQAARCMRRLETIGLLEAQ